MFIFVVGFCRQKLKHKPKSDLTLGIGLEVWKISWQAILLNLFWYSAAVISPITRRPWAVVGLYGATWKSHLIKRSFLNLESRSSACYSSSNFCLREFLNSSWRIWCFHICWICLYFCFVGISFPFTFLFPLMSHSSGFWCSGSWCSALLFGWISWHFIISRFAWIYYWWIWIVGLPVLGRKSFFQFSFCQGRVGQ